MKKKSKKAAAPKPPEQQADENGILYAYVIENTGRGVALAKDEISQAVRSDQKLAWVHMDARAAGTRAWLEREVSYLDPIILDALLATETRPRMVEFDPGLLLILRGVNLNENEEPEDMVSLRMWIDPQRIITIRRRQLVSVREIQEKLEAGKGPKNAGDFLSMLCARLFERMEPVLTELNETADDIEESVMEKPTVAQRQKIIDVRKTAILLHRYIAPQKDLLAQLRLCEQEWLDNHHRRRLQESFDRVLRYVEDLSAVRERAQIVKDELSHMLSDRLNKNMYVLSVVASIFLPLTFLTGLLGINVAGIPGAEHPDAFWVFFGLLAGVAALQALIFKLLRWF